MTSTRSATPARSAARAALLLFLGGCAGAPIETELEPSVRTPAEVSAGTSGRVSADPGEEDIDLTGGSGEGRGSEIGEGDALDAAESAGTETVLWGGVLLESRVLEEESQLEVLSHPLDRRQRPMTERASEGRFLIVADGYLETIDYAPGRLVTVLGTLEEVREGTIGEATVRFPVVRSERLHLWSGNAGRDERPRFTFGIGVNLGN